MKKINLLLFALLSYTIVFCQAPPVWKNYYSKNNLPYYADAGNSVYFIQANQLVKFDKASGFFHYIPIPNNLYACFSRHVPYNLEVSGFSTDLQGNVWISTQGYDPFVTQDMESGSTFMYDGTNWISFTPTLVNAGLEANLAPSFDRLGNMWFNSPGKGLTKYNGSTFTSWGNTGPHLPSQNFLSNVVFDLNNNFWVGTDIGIVEFNGTNFTLYDTNALNIHNGYAPYLTQLALGPSNTIYAGDGSDYCGYFRYYTITNGGVSIHPFDTAISGGSYTGIQAIFFDRQGSLYLGFFNGLVKDSAGTERLITDFPSYSVGSNFYSAPHTDSLGIVWLNIGFDFTSFDGTTFTAYYDPHAVLESNITQSLITDKRQNLWLGYATVGGLTRCTSYNFTSVLPASTPGNINNFTIDTAGMVWFGLAYINPLNDSVSLAEGTTSSCSSAMFGLTIDKNKNIWTVGSGACGSGLGIIANDSVQWLSSPPGGLSLNGWYWCVTADSTGNIWIGTSFDDTWDPGAGLVKYDGTNYSLFNPSNSGIPDVNIQALAVDPTNRLWIGTAYHGLSIYNGTTFVNYDSLNSPLPSNSVESFWFKDGVAYIGTQLGYCTFDGINWTTFTPGNCGLVNGDCESILVDEQCNVWLATECGLSLLVGQCNNLLKSLSGQVTQSDGTPVANTEVLLMHYDTTGGILKPVDNTFTDSNGYYSFATSDSIVYVHPEPASNVLDTVFPGYEDSTFVQQMARPIFMNTQTVIADVRLRNRPVITGSLSLKGTVTNQDGSKPAGLHLYLMQNGAVITTAIINIDGSFSFTGLSTGTYTIWVDKMSVDNTSAPSVGLGSANGTVTATLYPTYLQILTASILQPVSEAMLNLHPNPTTDQLCIKTENIQPRTITIYDVNGRIIYTSPFKTEIDVQQLSSGVYFIEVTSNEGVARKKFVKM